MCCVELPWGGSRDLICIGNVVAMSLHVLCAQTSCIDVGEAHGAYAYEVGTGHGALPLDETPLKFDRGTGDGFEFDWPSPPLGWKSPKLARRVQPLGERP